MKLLEKADLILKNGVIYSFSADGRRQRGDAVVVREGRIIDVCGNDDALRYCGKETVIVDCGGNTIMPGMCDAHCHPSSAASIFNACQMFDITGTCDETSESVINRYMDRLREYIGRHGGDDIIRAAGWNRAFFAGACREARWPDRRDIDKVCADRPVVMESYCQHALWVNTAALKMAGITKDTPDPPSGEIVRDDDGEPTGIFLELDALNLIKENLPGYDYSVEQYKETILRYQREEANRYGVTLLGDCLSTDNARRAYIELAKEGTLTLRVRGVYHWPDCRDMTRLAKICEMKGTDDTGDTFGINTIKIFLEGEFAMLKPYERDYNIAQGLPENYGGELFYSDQEAMIAVEKAVETGMQVHIHAMGDKAVKQAVDSLVSAQEKIGMRSRNVIAHLMAVRDEDMRRIGDNDIICNCQPRWMINDSDTAEYYASCFGKERAMNVYPHKRLLDAGATVAYGTDFPVTPPPDPFHEIQCAITRSVLPVDDTEYEIYGGTILGPEENRRQDCVTLDDAVRSITYSGAYQLFLEDVTGSLESGKSADIVVLDRNLEKTPVEEIYKTKAVMTIFKGEIVYKEEI